MCISNYIDSQNFNIEDIRKILFDFKMASPDLKQYVTYKLQTYQRTRAHT